MLARLSIVAGLVLGVAAARLLLGGLLALAPGEPLPSAALPSAAVVSAAPSVAAPPSAAPSGASGAASPSTLASGAPATAPSGAPFHVGQPAPPLVVPQVGGGTIDLTDFKGKPVWIEFTATPCPSCQDEFSRMNGFAARYGDDGLVVVAVDVGEQEAPVAAFAESLGATFPVGLDTDRKVADAWGVTALPVHFWIDAEGIVRHSAPGGIGPDEMVTGLKSIMPGVDVTP